MSDELQKPASEIDIAELLSLVSECRWAALTVRRLAFERDRLKAEVEQRNAVAASLLRDIECNSPRTGSW